MVADSSGGSGGGPGGGGPGGGGGPAARRAGAARAHACRALLVLRALASSEAQYTLLPARSETMVEHSTTGVAGKTTYRLTFTLEPSSMLNVYAMAGAEGHPLSCPPAFQVPPPFGANIGGVNPTFFEFMPDAQYDSWISVGISDGSQASAISASPGFDFSGWTETTGLGPFDNAAIFWMDPSAGPTGPEPVMMGQLTVPTGSSPMATALLQGRTVSTPGQDWQAPVTWEYTALAPAPPPPTPPTPPAPPSGTGGGTGGGTGQWQECDIPDIDECLSSPCENGATCFDSHNSTGIPHHQYRCACQAGYANGTCTVDWLFHAALCVPGNQRSSAPASASLLFRPVRAACNTLSSCLCSLGARLSVEY